MFKICKFISWEKSEAISLNAHCKEHEDMMRIPVWNMPSELVVFYSEEQAETRHVHKHSTAHKTGGGLRDRGGEREFFL